MRYTLALIALLTLSAAAAAQDAEPTVGLIYSEEGASPGYTLLAPLSHTTTYLLDLEGQFVHMWQHEYRPGASTYLLENGNLLRTANTRNETFPSGGRGGRVRMFDWDGTLLWDFEYSDSLQALHHDLEPLPNGNILMIAWEYKTMEEVIAAGRNPEMLPDSSLWPDKIIEVRPILPDSGEIVWEWHAWDHLIQDFDATKDNFGEVEAHPELIDLNYDPAEGTADWLHINAVDYNPELDQIVLSVPRFGEMWIIDHSTTTEEAAGHTGGLGGKGGDILYRWGNPRTYTRNVAHEKQLFFQHDAQWIEPGLPGAGNLLVFNNGGDMPDPKFSTVDEIVPPFNEGVYVREPDQPFGPDEPIWSYVADNPTDFVSTFISGAHRLPNGNTLICAGATGEIFEVTPDGDIVWHYVNPVTADGPLEQGEEVPDGTVGKANTVFRAVRYPPDFPAFEGRTLTPMGTVEVGIEDAVAGLPSSFSLDQNYPNPFNPSTTISFTLNTPAHVSLRIYDSVGREIEAAIVDQYLSPGWYEVSIDPQGWASGVYFYRLSVDNRALARTMTLLR